MGTAQHDPAAVGRPAWNAGREVGVKKPSKQRQIWAIRFLLNQSDARIECKRLSAAQSPTSFICSSG